MSSGKTHARDSAAIAAISGLAVAAFTQQPAIGLAFAGGSLSGILLTPDLDQEGISYSEWRIIKYTLGIGFLWVWYWLPYALLSRHRGLSHWPIVGTATRVMYILPLWILASSLERLAPIAAAIQPGAWLPAAILGLALSDLAHAIRDSRPRRRRRYPRRRRFRRR